MEIDKMNLEVGMYARTESGLISRINKITNENIFFDSPIYTKNSYGKFNTKYLKKEKAEIYIKKASHTLLGNDKEPCLIEVGDYVNGCLIVEIKQDPFIKGQINLWTNMILSAGEPFPNEYYKAKILEKDIKSIVTKEQMASMSYKVGD